MRRSLDEHRAAPINLERSIRFDEIFKWRARAVRQ
jgi:hypothetical protein